MSGEEVVKKTRKEKKTTSLYFLGFCFVFSTAEDSPDGERRHVLGTDLIWPRPGNSS